MNYKQTLASVDHCCLAITHDQQSSTQLYQGLYQYSCSDHDHIEPFPAPFWTTKMTSQKCRNASWSHGDWASTAGSFHACNISSSMGLSSKPVPVAGRWTLAGHITYYLPAVNVFIMRHFFHKMCWEIIGHDWRRKIKNNLIIMGGCIDRATLWTERPRKVLGNEYEGHDHTTGFPTKAQISLSTINAALDFGQNSRNKSES